MIYKRISLGSQRSFGMPPTRASVATRSLGRARILLSALAASGVALWACSVASADVVSQANPPVELRDFVAVTDDDASQFAPGCDSITIADSSDGTIVARSPQHISPGRLAVTSNASLVVTQYNNASAFIQVMLWRPAERSWRAASFQDNRLTVGGAIAISPDDDTLLVSKRNAVVKYLVAGVSLRSLGPEVASLDFGSAGGSPIGQMAAAAIEFTADSRTAYVVASDGYVHTLDVVSMTWRDAPLPYVVTAQRQSSRIPRTHATLSPDERWLVVNTADQQGGRLNLIDLHRRVSRLVDTPGLGETWGVAFNYVGDARGLLAVHGHAAVAVYRLQDGQLAPQATIPIPPQVIHVSLPGASQFIRKGAIAWGGEGARLIAGVGGRQEWRILRYDNGTQPALQRVADFDSCTAGRGLHMGIDVVTLHDRLHRPTLTPAPTASSTPTYTATVSATSSAVPTRPQKATPAATATPSVTPTATVLPGMLYLPLALREHCDPEHKRADIALVLDTSSSMTGQKQESARAAALLFVGMIDLEPGRSQVAVVRYDREAEVVRELTRAQALVDAAIRSLQVRSGTHIDKGLRAALGELQSPRHIERNLPVMILLTDGLQTGTPDEELRAAEEVRDAGIRLYTIGLGEDVDDASLKTMAGDDSRYDYAPDSGDLESIYAEIAQDLMCPGTELWGGR